jgi:putative ABC transport system permease protein
MVGFKTDTLAASLEQSASQTYAAHSSVNYDFFSTLKMELLAGRAFGRTFKDAPQPLSAPTSTPQSIVIDQVLAEQNGWLQPADAIGKLLYATPFGETNVAPIPQIVIGVVTNRPMSVVNAASAAGNVYVLEPTTASYPIIRISTADTGAALKEIASVWNQLAPDVALKLEFADAAFNHSYRALEILSAVFAAVATLALSISVFGLIGMSIQIIGRRQHEIGVRKTLDASVQSIIRLLVTDFSIPVIVANIISWPMAYLAMQLYLSMFAQRTSLSPRPFITGLVITVLIAWIAVSAQATRAARLNPATVLRAE